MPDWFSENAPSAAKPKDDWFDLYSPDRKPVSAEDFAPAPRGLFPTDLSLGNIAKHILRSPLDLANSINQDRKPEDALLGPAAILAPLIRGSASGAVSQAEKAKADLERGRYSEAAGHVGGMVPIIGQAAAQAGEDIGSGDKERQERGVASAITQVGAPFAPKIAGAVAPLASRISAPLASIGEQIAAKGGPIAKTVAKAALPVAADAALAHVGLPPVFTGAHIAGKIARSAIEAVGEAKATRAAEAAAAEDAAAPSANAGGRLIKDTPQTNEQAISDMLNEIRQEPAPARITTPPEPQLPAGYTPRATVPKAKMAKSKIDIDTAIAAAKKAVPDSIAPKRAYFLKPEAQIAEEAAARAERLKSPRPVEQGKRAYFLKPLEDMNQPIADSLEPATRRAAPAKVNIDTTDLPASWRAHVGQPLIKPTGAAGRALAAQVADVIKTRGLSPREAIDALTRDPSLSPRQRLELQTAIMGSLKGTR